MSDDTPVVFQMVELLTKHGNGWENNRAPRGVYYSVEDAKRAARSICTNRKQSTSFQIVGWPMNSVTSLPDVVSFVVSGAKARE